MKVLFRRLDTSLRDAVRKIPHPGLAGMLLRLVLLTILLTCASHLVFGEKPWPPAEENANSRETLAFHIRSGLWYGALFNLILSVGLLATIRWWLPPPSGENHNRPGPPPLRPSTLPARVFWLSITPVILLAAWLRAPLLDDCLYGDEIYSIEQFIHGTWQIREGREPRFRQPEWNKTLWGYQRPNNHIPASILIRTAHETWARTTMAEPGQINVTVMRLPGMLAALAGIALAAWWLWTNGRPAAGWIAAVIAAIHPWHINHSVEVRGYPFVFLFAVMVLVLAHRALVSGSWRAWSALAFSQLLLLHTYPAALYALVPLSLVIAIHTWTTSRGKSRRTQLTRFLIVHAMMTGILVQLMAPCVGQLRDYLAFGAPQGEGTITADWLRDLSALFAFGKLWHPWEQGNPFTDTYSPFAAMPAGLSLSAFLLVAALGIFGLWRLRSPDRVMFLVLLPFLVAPALAILHAKSSGSYLFTWYVIYALPAWTIALAMGIAPPKPSVASSAAVTWPRASPAAGIALVLLVAFAIATSPARQIIRTHPAEPTRQIVNAMHAEAARFPEAHTPILASLYLRAAVYDPTIRRVVTIEDVEKLKQEARETKRPLLLASSFLDHLQTREPSFHQLITTSDTFTPIVRLHGRQFGNRSILLVRYDP